VFCEDTGYIWEPEPGWADRGGGAPACAANLDRILSVIRFDVVDMALARRQNLEAKLPGLRLMGKWLASAGSSG
jgi:hypothetical protein